MNRLNENALLGGCHCGKVRYAIRGGAQPMAQALCHCRDCRRSAGAPAVGWAMFKAEDVTSTGRTETYHSSEHGRRQFCPACGTGIFYSNAAVLPGIIDIQSATLDNADALPPQVHIQVAERVGWWKDADKLPEFERFPPHGQE